MRGTFLLLGSQKPEAIGSLAAPDAQAGRPEALLICCGSLCAEGLEEDLK